MADVLQLTGEQTAWRDALQQRIDRFPLNADYEIRIKELTELRDLAVKLHNALTARGQEPRHHKHMITNRGFQPDHPEFYLHIHPIQDLIKFTYDPHANDDPADQTIGHEFEVSVFSRRWKHEDTHRLTRTETGWHLSTMSLSYTGDCDKSAQPHFFDSLKHDSVQYPRGACDWFEWLWDQAKQKGLSHEQVQAALNEIAEWINSTEKSAPCKGVWEGLTCPL